MRTAPACPLNEIASGPESGFAIDVAPSVSAIEPYDGAAEQNDVGCMIDVDNRAERPRQGQAEMRRHVRQHFSKELSSRLVVTEYE